jgi:hypothetical protein
MKILSSDDVHARPPAVRISLANVSWQSSAAQAGLKFSFGGRTRFKLGGHA